MALFIQKLFQDMSGDRQWKRVIKWRGRRAGKNIMIACHASPEGESSGLHGAYPKFQIGGFQHYTSTEYERGGGGGGGVITRKPLWICS